MLKSEHAIQVLSDPMLELIVAFSFLHADPAFSTATDTFYDISSTFFAPQLNPPQGFGSTLYSVGNIKATLNMFVYKPITSPQSGGLSVSRPIILFIHRINNWPAAFLVVLDH